MVGSPKIKKNVVIMNFLIKINYYLKEKMKNYYIIFEQKRTVTSELERNSVDGLWSVPDTELCVFV